MRSRDDGFTLVELLLSISILALVIGPLTGAIVLLLRTNGATTSRVSAAHDELMLATFWPADVQSATTVSLTDTASCPAVGPGASLVARLRWTDLDSGAVTITKAVAYWSLPASGTTDAQLVRETCDDAGSPGALAVRGSVTVTHQQTSAAVTCFSGTGTDTTAAGCLPLSTARLTVANASSVTATVLTGRRRSA